MTSAFRRTVPLCIVWLAWLTVAGGGCVYVSTTEITTSAGAASAAVENLQWLVDGETAREVVEANLGPPVSVEEATPGRQVLVYAYQTRTVKQTRAPLVLRTRRESTRFHRVKFEIADGVVVRHWRESTP